MLLGLALIHQLRSGSRESYGEGCAVSKFARDTDRPAVRLYDESHDAQAEPATGAAARETLINLVETIEHSFCGATG